MWLLALIACAVLAAVFLVVTLAQIEAGTRTRGKWLAYTVCSLAMVTALIIFKPKPNMEQVQYMQPFLNQEPLTESKNAAAPKSEAWSTGPAVAPGGSGDLQGLFKADQVAQGTGGQAGGVQWGGAQQDPVLEEILFLKRQAEERKKAAVPAELTETVEKPGEPVPSAPSNEETIGISNIEATAEPKIEQAQDGQVKTPSSTSGSTEIPTPAQVQKAKVIATTLNVRDQGRLDGKVVGYLKSGELVEVVERSEAGGWVEVKMNNGQSGWVMKKYLSILP